MGTFSMNKISGLAKPTGISAGQTHTLMLTYKN